MTALMPWERSGSKVTDWQLTRLAVVYVRQSSMQQVSDHQESTRLQYALVDRAVSLGWPASRVVVIDEDLGRSGASAVGRSGFQRLVTEIGLDHVGLVLGVEMSRLARSGKDWYQLIELCALGPYFNNCQRRVPRGLFGRVAVPMCGRVSRVSA
ncbi:Resolvase domain-containing protein [Streptomyces violaceusniger Tu 4113]|uniref:Resolvase domain-containing protein n=1 Tax=Streptomyces violaceusniger (strain Tu 4113) TaxID=653045 RepID=G2NZZ5_STRV4|nr:recombinase family protein [Streptomyces violaceusniger]AEM80231.1 Resolvase domain-containing protein [Streptomyces violaceusniger Tu 4113]